MLHTKKIYYKRNGVEYPIDLFTSTDDVGSSYIAYRDGASTVYAPVVDEGHAVQSHICIRKSGTTKRIGLTSAFLSGWEWAARAGGTGADHGLGVSVDGYGNVYVTGFFNGTATFGSTILTSAGSDEVFIAKLNSQGQWQWAVKAGGASSDQGLEIATDLYQGDSYIVGTFSGTATFGTINLTSLGNTEIFAAKINSAGQWQWAIRAGGTSSDRGFGITFNPISRACYISGFITGTARFVGPSGDIVLVSAGTDAFVAKLRDDTGICDWAVKGGGSSTDECRAIYYTGDGALVAGYINATATFGNIQLTGLGGNDIYVAKVSSDGVWEWAAIAGSAKGERGLDVSADYDGNAYVTGFYNVTATFGGSTITAPGRSLFVAKINSLGQWQWAIDAGTTSTDESLGIATDGSGCSYLTGYYSGSRTFGSKTITSSGSNDIFVAKLGTDGTWLDALSAGAGGTSGEFGKDIAINPMDGSCHVTGFFSGPSMFGSVELSHPGFTTNAQDIFVAKCVI